uniref:Gypsy retrotransposon integrase-like protein 1 n=1 Tax=Paramormyrops kingsleyae TaxID=1676925 RepID=A0A3B3QR63_9TELE
MIGLVGSRSLVRLTVGRIQHECLIDSGSQVTTISRSFYDAHLASHPIRPIDNLLEVEGAAGQRVPYIGYIEIDIHFPETFTGRPKSIIVLALIVPNSITSAQVSVLIGTNALDILYEGFDERVSGPVTENCAYAALVQHLRSIYKSKAQDKAGKVKLLHKRRIVIPAGQKVVLDGYVKNVNSFTGSSFLVDYPSNSYFLRGLTFCSYIMTSPRRTSFKVPILLKNETRHNITVPAHCILAELTVPVSVSLLTSPKGDSRMENKDPPSFRLAAGCYAAHPVSPENDITFDFGDSPLTEEWKERITKKLNLVPEVFARGDLDYGHTTAVKHKIRLSDPTPFKQRVRPIHPSDYEAVRLHLKELYDANIIRESESPFASPVVIVKKKNGKIRLCIDYRKLNAQTIKDAYALPNIEETFTALTGSRWFSVMDLKSGFYQVEMVEEDKPKTAFVTPMGFWEFNRMPQGVTNAPSTFQRVMEKCMSSLNLKEVLVFLDDLIVFSETLEQHEERLMRVLNRLKEFGLKLSPEKCCFFRKSVKYLGHIVSENGVETDPDKISALTTWPRPNNIKELKSFLGFTGYYRRFIKDFSRIAKPLNDLTVGYIPSRKCRTKPFSSTDMKTPFAEKWTAKCEEAFKTLIEKLTTAPVLGFANPRMPYILHTDASLHGLGAALYQEQDGQVKVIAYASRGLSNCERRYPTHKLEFLALKWAITDKLADYLYGAEFIVVTDNNPLTYILTSAKLDAAGHRWLAALSSFNFSIKYRAGKRNQDADGLSRRPHDFDGADLTAKAEEDRVLQFLSKFLKDGGNATLPTEAIKAVCQRHELDRVSGTGGECSYPPAIVESLAIDASAVPTEFTHTDLLPGSNTLPRMSLVEWAAEQRADPVINRVIDIVNTGKRLSYRVRQKEDREIQLMLRVQDQLVINNSVLYRRRLNRGELFFQLVLPKKYRAMALEALHDSVGHMGFERTIDLVRARFYWPKMSTDVDSKLRTCERCIRRKAKAEKTARLVNIRTSRPLELACMDYLSLEPDGRGTKNILVITDHFTKYAVAVPTTDQKAKTVAKTLWNNFFVHYGIPECLHSDLGRDFESAVIKDLCLLLGIKKTRTTPYHPRGNPVERFNRTLLEMLGTLEEENKVKWRDHVQPLVHAYNCTKNDTTGFSPYQLMFGRQPSLPLDVVFGLNPEGQSKITHSDYVKRLKENLQESYKLALEHSERNALKNKERYDLKVRETILEEGDHVLVKNVGVRGKHKIADRWSRTVYKVAKRIHDSPVYVVAPVDSSGPNKTLHRDLLLPCGFLAPSVEAEMTLPRQEKSKVQNPMSEEEGEYFRHSCESEEEVEDEYYYPRGTPKTSYPSITIVHELPQSDLRSPSVSSSFGESSLRPEAEEFQPRDDQQQDFHQHEVTDLLGDALEGREDLHTDARKMEEEAISEGDHKDERTGEESLNESEDVLQDLGVNQQHGETEVRRSTRHRTEPDRLTYHTRKSLDLSYAVPVKRA